MPTDLDKSTVPSIHKRLDNNTAPFEPYVRIPVETMDSLEVWHCGGWVERFSCCGWLAAVRTQKKLLMKVGRSLRKHLAWDASFVSGC